MWAFGQRFDRAECLRGNDEHRRGRVEPPERGVHIGSVDVRDEVSPKSGVPKCGERFRRHRRAEVAAANADVDDVGDPAVGTNTLREHRHRIEHGVHVGHHVDTLDLDHGVPRGTQGGVQHGTILGDVDPLAREHGVATRRHTRRFDLCQQARQHVIVDRLLRVIDPEVNRRQRDSARPRSGSFSNSSVRVRLVGSATGPRR